MPSASEFELKFEVISPQGARNSSNPLYQAVADAKPVHLRAVYFETDAGDLRRAGLTLRVRSDGTRHVMTLKSDGSTPFDRGEWERDVPDLTPDLALFADTPHAEVLQALEPGSLRARLDTDVQRRSVTLPYRRSGIEITLDEGEVRAAGRSLPLCEFELELAGGRRDDIFAFVRALPALPELRIGLISKGERGFRLADGTWGQPVKGAPVTLSAEMSAGQAFAAIAHACLRQFALNQPAFDHGEPVEGVHQSRVAFRRLKAALSLFKPLFATDRSLPKLREELGWIGDLLGRARDLDVLQTETVLPALEAQPDAPGLAELAKALEAQREAAHGALREAMASQRLSRLLFSWTLWLEDGPWRKSRAQAIQADRDGPVGDYVRAELGRRFEKFCEKAEKLRRLSGPQLHRERIRAKKLRYGSQFFESLARGGKAEKGARRLIKATEAIQSALGEIQDAETRSSFLAAEARDWARKIRGDASLMLFAAGRLAATEPDREALIDRAAKAARKACASKPFWESL